MSLIFGSITVFGLIFGLPFPIIIISGLIWAIAGGIRLGVSEEPIEIEVGPKRRKRRRTI